MRFTDSDKMTETTETQPQDGVELRATFFEHLSELRTRIVWSISFIAVGWVVGYFLEPAAYAWATRPLIQALGKHTPQVQIAYRNFADPFLMQIKVGLFIGIGLAAPLITWQLWLFIAPGLNNNERKGIRFVAPLSVILFAIGVTFGCAILPACLRWFLNYLPRGATLIQDPQVYILFLVKMLLAFGLAFELPVVVLFLAKIGLINAEMMWKYWRQGVVGISVVAMVLTPSNDAVTMLAMAFPMVILYFLSIFLIGRTGKPVSK